MGALAHTDRVASGWLDETGSRRLERTQARRNLLAERRRTSWNVLAHELVAFPPAAGLTVSHPGQSAARRTESAKAPRAVPESSAPTSPAGCNAAGVRGGASLRRAATQRAEVRLPAVKGDRASSKTSGRIVPRSRGLRRLLPGAATLAVLVSVWFGAGALSALHRPPLMVPTAAVRIPGGYLYVARPGDTLWSIASQIQPGGDPRPLVAELEQQLHGAELAVGDRLTLP